MCEEEETLPSTSTPFLSSMLDDDLTDLFPPPSALNLDNIQGPQVERVGVPENMQRSRDVDFAVCIDGVRFRDLLKRNLGL